MHGDAPTFWCSLMHVPITTYNVHEVQRLARLTEALFAALLGTYSVIELKKVLPKALPWQKFEWNGLNARNAFQEWFPALKHGRVRE